MLPACRSLYLLTLHSSAATTTRTTSILAQDLRHRVAVVSGQESGQELRDFKCLHTSSISNMESQMGQVQSTITSKLEDNLQPTHLEVINESYMHNVPRGSETHFKVVVVSETFEGMPLIKRHRLVMDTLKHELDTGVHALSIQAKTPEQWETSGGKVAQSPPCLGGSKR